jgi:hypothetical protein
VIHEPVPKLKSLQVNECFFKVTDKFPLLIDFMPDYSGVQAPEHNYFWALFKSIYKKEADEFVKNAEAREFKNRFEISE